MKTRNTARVTWETCPRKYYWNWKKDYVTKYGSTALRFGSAWHEILANYYQSVIDKGWEETKRAGIGPALRAGKEVWDDETENLEFKSDYRTFENLTTLFLEYLDCYAEESEYLEPIAVERKEISQIKVPDSEMYPYMRNKTIQNISTIDMLAKIHHEPWIIEHKSTGMYLSGFVKQNARSSQVYSYFKLAKELGVVGVITNVAQCSSRKLKSGDYSKVTTNFLRQPELFSVEDMEEYDHGFFDTCEAIERASALKPKVGFQAAYPCKVNSCQQIYGQCSYRELCDQSELIYTKDEVPEGFRLQDISQSLSMRS